MARETQQQQQQQQQMEKIHDSVLDAIHNALSKESLIKKLVLPFNETLSSARSRVCGSVCVGWAPALN
jgi:hypothetical protein